MDIFLENPGLLHIGIQILEYLDPFSLANCRRVNQTWYEVISGQKIWPIALIKGMKQKTETVNFVTFGVKVTLFGLDKTLVDQQWQLWSPFVEKAKHDLSTQDFKKLPIFLEDQFYLIRQAQSNLEGLDDDDTHHCTPWIGLEKLLTSGDIKLAMMILRWLKKVKFGLFCETSACGLIYSCRLGLEKLTKILLSDPLEEGITVNTTYDECPAIVAACQFHPRTKVFTKARIVQTLLEDPALNVNAKSGYSSSAASALHYSIFNEDVEVIMTLLTARPDINVNIDSVYNLTPVYFLCGQSYRSLDRWMKRRKNNIEATTKVLALLLSHPDIDINIRTSILHDTPLMHAERFVGYLDDPEDVTKVVEAMNYLWEMSNGQTVAQIACKRGHLEALKLLYTCDKEVIQQRSSFDGSTLLHQAVKYAHLGIVRFLLSIEDVHVNATDTSNMTPLHYACLFSNGIEIVMTLLSVPSVEVNALDGYGKTPRDYCRERHWYEANYCIDAMHDFHLLDSGVNICIQTYDPSM